MLPFFQNPQAITIKKYLFEMLKERYSKNEKFIDFFFHDIKFFLFFFFTSSNFHIILAINNFFFDFLKFNYYVISIGKKIFSFFFS